MKLLKYAIVAMAMVLAVGAAAQNDTEFWFAAPEITFKAGNSSDNGISFESWNLPIPYRSNESVFINEFKNT